MIAIIANISSFIYWHRSKSYSARDAKIMTVIKKAVKNTFDIGGSYLEIENLTVAELITPNFAPEVSKTQ